jgi:hypothetical protein
MGISTSVGQVALLGGGRNERPGGILVEEPASRFGRGRSLGNLYVVVDVSGPEMERDAIAWQMAETIRETYYGRRGSITAGLQQALQEANNFLFRENRNSLPGERRTAGVSCVVLRDNDLFVAQAGPALIYLAQEGAVRRLPESSPWLDGFPPEEMDATALGERRDANTFLFHTPVRGGETVLLANCDLAQQVKSAEWPQLLALEPMEALLEEVFATSQGGDLSVLVVRLGEESPQSTPVPSTGDTGGAVALGNVLDRASGWATDLRVGEWLEGSGQAVLHFLGGLWLGLLSLLRSMMPDKPGSAAVTAGKAPATPARKKRSVPRRPSRSDPVQKVLIGVAIAIPIVVGIVVLVTLLQRGQTQRAEMEALWQQASTQWEQAQTASEPAVIREHLTAAEQHLQELLGRWPEDAEAQDLKSKVESRLDVINEVQRVSWVELNTYEEDAILSRVVVQGTHVFVLDHYNDRVYHHQLDEAAQPALKAGTKETVLVSKGDQVGGVLVADLVDMVWMPLGNNRQKASLVILESGGTLLDYDPTTGELLPLQVAATDRWQFPELVGSHSGRLYVLDSTANQIWRYNPTPEGYAGSPDEWLQEEIDLAGVIDMAIGDSIYLLYANGQIRKLTVGQTDSFATSDWDTPPHNPTALFTRPPDQTQWLYVGDEGNSRIVQASKEGDFQQQFRLTDAQMDENGDPLAQLSSLFVDEIGGHAFVLGGNKLYVLILPMGN